MQFVDRILRKQLAGEMPYWIWPAVLCLVLYWRAPFVWFQLDDFAWLGLHRELARTGDVGRILFEPMAQGTFRPLSERAFFLVLYSVFGLNPLPFHLVVLATHLANILLLLAIGNRLTGSRRASLLAAILWTSHQALGVPLTWLSAYNQNLYTFFFLLAFLFLLRWVERERLTDWIAQLGAFGLGLGAHEAMVVYPIAATAFCALFAPTRVRRTLWLWLGSLLYTAFRWNAISSVSGAYALHFDIAALDAFVNYCAWALGHPSLDLSLPVSHVVFKIGVLCLTTALATFVVAKTQRRQWLAAFLVLWFLITLMPYVPLADHTIGYYLTLPSISLCLLGGWAAIEAWSASTTRRVLAVSALAIYLIPSILSTQLIVSSYIDRGLRTHQLINDIRAIEGRQPGKVLLLQGVTPELFAESIHHRPFERIGISTEVYLAPADEEWTNDPAVLAQTYPAEAAEQLIRLGGARVLDVGELPVNDVTEEYFQKGAR